jgi:hypothetical protein
MKLRSGNDSVRRRISDIGGSYRPNIADATPRDGLGYRIGSTCMANLSNVERPRMGREVRLNRVDTVLADLEYPITRADAAAQCGDVILLLADGEAQMSELLARSNDDVFIDVDDVLFELLSLLPQRAVGEPYQSEGEG